MDLSYVPELDDSYKLEPKDIKLYQEIIGMLRWVIEIRRVDILHEVSILLQYQACP